MKRLLSIVILWFSATCVFAQVDTISQSEQGAGVIIINQDARIPALVDAHVAINKTNNGKTAGWRVQIYSSSGTSSRSEAQNVRKAFLAKYPETNAYLIYQPPFFKIRVGDFRTKEEAYSFYKKLLSEYPISYLITDQINYPKLQEKVETPTSTNDLDKLLEGIY